MKLDRNTVFPKRGKYALVKLRSDTPVETGGGQYLTFKKESVDFGIIPHTEFFVIRLRDKYAGPALHAYAEAAKADDPEYAAEVDALAQAADRIIPKHIPD